MDINMPDMDGIAATERLSAEVPTAAVVMMSVQGEADYLRRSMLAGAREFLVKPFSLGRAHLVDPAGLHPRAGEAVPDRGRSPPPSAGRRRHGRRGPAPAPSARTASPAASSPCSAPRAASAARRSPSTSRSPRPPSSASGPASSTRSFQFGDIGVLLNLNPKNKSIADIIPELESTGEHRVARHLRHQPLGRHQGAARAAVARRWPSSSRRPAPSAWSRPSARRTTSWSSTACRPSTTRRSRSSTWRTPSSRCSRSRSRRSRTSASSSRWRISWGTGRTRSGSSSIAPIRRWASASPTWSTRSGGAWTTRSSPMAGASSTPSTGACRSSSPIARRRSHRTCCGSPRPWLARTPADADEPSRKAGQKKSLFAWR